MKTRWMDAIKTEAAASGTEMPWERGARRRAMMTRRKSAELKVAAERARARMAVYATA